ncbi:MAG: MOSC domain-containing protein [Anaerolineae bacterium]
MSNTAKQPHIFQINCSDGGVPKGPVREGQVTSLGLEGDRHNDTVHHGGPERALCLYALERIVDLQAEGHPIYPGSTGENVTLVGLDWAQVVPGTRLRLGDEVRVEITLYTTPCQKIAVSFAGGQIQRMSQDEHPGWSRVYARVLSPGTIRVGDAVRVERNA